MAFSGTISTTVFNTNKVLTSAVRRCKVPAEQITAETWDIAKDELHLLLSDLANQGVPLWCIEKQIYPLYDGQGAVTMGVGTVDVLNTFFRTLPQVTGTNTDTSTTRTVEFSSATVVTGVGILWSATSVPIALERSDDGVTWETAQNETPSASAGEWTWFDLTAALSATWFRVRATSGTLSFDQVYLGNNPQEIPLYRMNRDDWTNLPNKFFKSNRVLQFWFDRQIPQPIMRFWPIPNAEATTSQATVWRQRYVMDVGTLTQELNVPQRWQEAIVCGLARKMARTMIEVDPKIIPMLDSDAAIAFQIAQAEERDNSPINWSPHISAYTS